MRKDNPVEKNEQDITTNFIEKETCIAGKHEKMAVMREMQIKTPRHTSVSK